VRALRDEGVAVVRISHCIDEVLALADHATVLRDGTVEKDDAKLCTANSHQNPGAELSDIEDMISRNVDALIVQTVNVDSLKGDIAKAIAGAPGAASDLLANGFTKALPGTAGADGGEERRGPARQGDGEQDRQCPDPAGDRGQPGQGAPVLSLTVSVPPPLP
jgi:energy-coupling factor transporter ATP-binding protein EcfA2